MIQIEVKVKFENQDYILKYNENSGYFECNLPSGEIGGVKTVNVEAKGIYDDTIYESKKIQILKKLEEKVELNEQVAYFFDRQTFKLKEISNYENYNINIDEERFITYSYACVGQEYWQDEKTLKLLEKEFYKFEWDIKAKEEKQQFISKYIDNIVIDKTDTGSLDIKQINFIKRFMIFLFNNSFK